MSRAHPAFSRHRAQWDWQSVWGQLRTIEEVRVLGWMVDGARYPLPRYSLWTERQVLSRIRNMAQQRLRRIDHWTGAE
jgi:hypothetical protein